MPTGYTTVSGANLTDATGTKITNATISFQPCNNQGSPVSFCVDGAGQATDVAVTALVTAGAFSAQLADTTLTRPVNIAYQVTVIDNVSGKQLLGPGYLIQPSGTAWSFDAFVPNLGALATIQLGPVGPIGPVSPENVAAIRTATEKPLRNRCPSPSSAWSAGFIDYTTGALTVYTTYQSTPFMVANAGGQMVASAMPPGAAGTNGLAFYDVNKTYISGIKDASLAAGTPFSVPANAAFLRIGFVTAPIGTLMVVDGATLPSSFNSFEEYTETEVDALLVTETARSLSIASKTMMAIAPAVFNIFDQTKLTNNFFVQGHTGALMALSQVFATDYMVCAGQSFITCNFDVLNHDPGNPNPLSGCFFDDQYNWLGNIGFAVTPAGTPIAVPAGAFYVRLTFSASYPGYEATNPALLMVVWGSTVPASYVGTISSLFSQIGLGQPWAGKKFYVFGDSISIAFGTQWQNIVTALTGAVLGTNDAAGGRTLYEAFTTYSNGTTVNLTTLTAALATHDFIVLQLGTNDVRGNGSGYVPLGSITDTPYVPVTVQGSTLPAGNYPASYSAYAQGVIDTIQSCAPTKRLIVLGVYHLDRIVGQTLPPGDYDATNLNPIVDSFNGMMKQVCAARGIRFVDLAATCGINKITMANPDGSPLFLRDHLHPSDTLGYPAVGHQIAHEIVNTY